MDEEGLKLPLRKRVGRKLTEGCERYRAGLAVVAVIGLVMGVAGVSFAESVGGSELGQMGRPEELKVEVDESRDYKGGMYGASEIGGEETRGRAGVVDGDMDDMGMVRANLPSRYSSREESFGAGVRYRLQNSEGLCWAYSTTTALEYFLAKKGMSGKIGGDGISAKHLDYQMVAANIAYKADDVAAGARNALYDSMASVGMERTLGDGMTRWGLSFAFLDPLAVMTERQFTSVIKANDSRLAAITRYEDIWEVEGLEGTVLDSGGNYTEKQRYSAINDRSASKIMATETREIYDGSFGVKTDTVNAIKNAIYNNGAVAVSTFMDSAGCADSGLVWDEGSGDYVRDTSGRYEYYYVVIDKGSLVCDSNTGHALTIVGWDDNLKYKDGEEEKTGAFIIQNTWPENAKARVGSSQGTVTIDIHRNYYMSYESTLSTMYFTSVEDTEAYDKYYTAADYKTSTIVAGDTERVFEFEADGKETLKEMSFLQAGLGMDMSYDIYLSKTGNANGFMKLGTVTWTKGMNKYVFPSETTVEGRFAIKLVRAAREFTEDEKAMDLMTVFADEVASQDFVGEITNNTGGVATIASTSPSSFTISSDQSCVVLYTTNNGQTYNRLVSSTVSGHANMREYSLSQASGAKVVVALAGDANGDKSVNVRDARRIINYILGKDTLSVLEQQIADVDNKDGVNVRDARAVIKSVMGTAIGW